VDFLFDEILYVEAVLEEGDVFLSEDGEDEFVVVLESLNEIIFGHDGVFDPSLKEGFLEEIIKFDFIEVSDDEDIDDIIWLHFREIPDAIGYRYEADIFFALKEGFQWFYRIVSFDENIRKFVIYRRTSIERIELLFVLFFGSQYPEIFEIHELSSDRIDLLVDISTKFPNKKPDSVPRNRVFDDKFFKYLGSTLRSEKFR